jgi:hypothetical protein
MESLGTWFITATSPLGKETYNLRLNSDGSGSISHDRGTIDFIDALITTSGELMSVKICGHTDIPMSVDFMCQFDSMGRELNGLVEIGEYANIGIRGVKI